MSGQIRHFSQGDFSVEAYIDVNQQAYQAIQPAVLQAVILIRRLRADLSAGLLPAGLLRTGQSWTKRE